MAGISTEKKIWKIYNRLRIITSLLLSFLTIVVLLLLSTDNRSIFPRLAGAFVVRNHVGTVLKTVLQARTLHLSHPNGFVSAAEGRAA